MIAEKRAAQGERGFTNLPGNAESVHPSSEQALTAQPDELPGDCYTAGVSLKRPPSSLQ